MYDYERYAKKLNELKAAGDSDALEAFLLGELAIIDEPLAGSGSCPCGRTQEELHQEVLAWVQERLTNQIVLRNDLASLYRDGKRWDKCEKVFSDMMQNIAEAELADSPLHGRILLNRACMFMDAGNLDAALDDATRAASIFDGDPEIDTDSVVAVYNLLSAIYAKKGDDQHSVLARDMAEEARKK
ncbi:MAG: hypothetical protein MR033_00070 [Clostridiales bacterium]|nr:hypothetical protein [Clostridiales bacterium]